MAANDNPGDIEPSGDNVPPVERKSRAAARRALRPIMIDPNQLYSILEYAASRDMSPAGVWLEIGDRKIAVTKDGGRTKIGGSEAIRRNREVIAGNR